MYSKLYTIVVLLLFIIIVSPGQNLVHAQDNALNFNHESYTMVYAEELSVQRAPQSTEASERQQQLQRSREIVDQGLSIAMDGSLRKLGDRWFLTAEHTLHELLFGLDAFVQELGLTLESGKQVRVTGFYHAPDDDPAGIIVVNSLVMDEQTYRFREEDGTPLWRGRGRGTGTGSRVRTP